jgi:SAM-dependent methyltransferase
MSTAASSGTCIVCRAPAVERFLDLGETALANKFRTEQELAEPEETFPLAVGFCRSCGHVQLMEIVPPAAMFEDYLYVSAASDTLREHLYELSDVVVERYRPGPGELVMDIGCNDGTLLQGFARYGVRTLGVDPARNLAELSRNGVERYVGFFNARSAEEIVDRWGHASVITATNTFPHIPELHDFVEGLNTALAPNGVFVIEAHYLLDLLEQIAFDTIYHEHVSYWALTPMRRLFAEHGMEVVHVERLPVHHGQLRIAVQRAGEGEISPSVEEVLEHEREAGLDRLETYERFAERARQIKSELRLTLDTLRADGKRIAGYGAPAKGNTLLSYLELGPDVVEYIADRNKLKQGRYTPQTRIPVVDPERLLSDQPDFVVLFAWNFADEVLAQQAEFRRRGGRFIIPIPDVTVVD